MTDSQDFQSLDQLFRKTFEELPETPAASGWDTPSPRVWENVQRQTTPQNSGWTLKTWALLAGILLLLAGSYWYFQRPPQNTPITTPPTPAATPSAPVTAPVETPANTNTQPEKSAETPSNSTAAKPARPAKQQPVKQADEASKDGTAQPFPLSKPGSKNASPNTTEEKKQSSGSDNKNL